jgi:hypothetical protein
MYCSLIIHPGIDLKKAHITSGTEIFRSIRLKRYIMLEFCSNSVRSAKAPYSTVHPHSVVWLELQFIIWSVQYAIIRWGFLFVWRNIWRASTDQALRSSLSGITTVVGCTIRLVTDGLWTSQPLLTFQSAPSEHAELFKLSILSFFFLFISSPSTRQSRLVASIACAILLSCSNFNKFELHPRQKNYASRHVLM